MVAGGVNGADRVEDIFNFVPTAASGNKDSIEGEWEAVQAKVGRGILGEAVSLWF